jgi:fructokinase
VIVVCGEALIDVIRNPDGTQHTTPGGGPFNTARALARLGVPTAFLGRLSTDARGRRLAELMRGEGVSLALATSGPEPTTTAMAEIDSRGLANYRFTVEGTSAPNLTQNLVPQRFDPDVSALHVGTLGLALEPMASTLAALVARERGRQMVMVDPNVRPGLAEETVYRQRLLEATAGSTLVKASDADLEWLFPGLTFERAAAALLEDGVDLVVVTLGAAGAFGAHRDLRLRVAAEQIEVVDTIGAGDAFGAALLAWLHDHGRVAPRLELEEAELLDALRYSCRAAAITCSRAGASPPHRWELEPPA